MNKRGYVLWYRLTLALAPTLLFGLLAYATLVALPVSAASEIPNLSDREIALTPLADPSVFTVTGVVERQDGTEVAAVQVFAFSGAASAETSTDVSGHFTLPLTVGNFYDIVFNPPSGSHLASQFRRAIHEEQFLKVTLPPGRAISGIVYRDATKSTTVANVDIFAFNTHTYDGLGLPPSKGDGSYQISLEEGPWELTFTPPPFLSLGPTRTETISLTADITKDIILQSGFTVYGQAITRGGAGQANVEIYAQDPSQPYGYGFSPSDPSGYYTGTLPAGTFDLQFHAPPFLGLGSTVVENITGPPDVELSVTLPAGHTVSGTVKCGGGLANAFVSAAPQPPPSAGFFGDWGRFAGADGFYALALQPGIYTFAVSPPGGFPLPQIILPMVEVTQDLTLDFDYHCLFLPIVLRGY